MRNAVRSQAHNRTVVLDVAEISAVDAHGLGVLVSLRMWADATGTELKMLNLTPRVEEVLELTKLRSAFDVCSVRDMLDLLCCVTDQVPLAAQTPASIYSSRESETIHAGRLFNLSQ